MYDSCSEMHSIILGLKIDINNLKTLLFFAFHLSFYLYIVFSLFINDLKLGESNLFLRMDMSKWFVFKIISVFIIIFLIELFNFLTLSLLFFLCLKSFQLSIILLIKDLIFIWCFLVIMYISYICSYYFVLALLFFYLFTYYQLSISNINIILYLIFIVLSVIIGILLVKYNKNKLIEKV